MLDVPNDPSRETSAPGTNGGAVPTLSLSAPGRARPGEKLDGSLAGFAPLVDGFGSFSSSQKAVRFLFFSPTFFCLVRLRQKNVGEKNKTG
jgi:hypothetical protein